MPTWDGITPETERANSVRKGSATNFLLVLHGVGFLLSAAAIHVDPLRAAVASLPYSAGPAVSGLEAWRFLTWTFSHGLEIPSLAALVIFGWVLFRMGNELEAAWGARRMLALYAGASLYGAVGQHAWQVLARTPDPAAGLAAPALAVFLAWAWRHPGRTILFLWVLPLKARMAWFFAFAGALVFAIGWSARGGAPAAVVAAALGAWGFVRFEGTLDGWFEAWESRARRRRYLEEFDLKRRCEELLAKISREGMGSLTRAERATLKRASGLYRRGDDSP